METDAAHHNSVRLAAMAWATARTFYLQIPMTVAMATALSAIKLTLMIPVHTMGTLPVRFKMSFLKIPNVFRLSRHM